jgi:hypothetical protein
LTLIFNLLAIRPPIGEVRNENAVAERRARTMSADVSTIRLPIGKGLQEFQSKAVSFSQQ